MDLLDKVRTDRTPFRIGAVQNTPELQRIYYLPYRDWQTQVGDQSAQMITDLMTQAFRTPNGEMSLRLIQGAALAELFNYGGVLVPGRVGAGKTIISLLAAAVVNAQRPLLLIPAGLRHKTNSDWLRYSKHFQLPRVRVEHYEQLGRVSHAEYLNNYRPDLIISDECHRLKDPGASSTKRVIKYMRAHPETRFVGLSGTITTRSLLDYQHILRWCLKDNTPLPRDLRELLSWSQVIDVKRDADIPAPGALVSFCIPSEREEVEACEKAVAYYEANGQAGSPEVTANRKRVNSIVRQAYQRRLTSTPGVISSLSDTVNCSLSIQQIMVDLSHLEPYYEQLRNAWETPDGHPFSEAVELWRHARELACGFFYRWDPRPPKEGLDARRAWSSFVRHTMSHHRKYDSEKHVALAIVNGELRDIGHYAAWVAIRDSFKPNTVPVWLDDVTVKEAAAWLTVRGKPPGLAWVEHTAVGKRISELTGLPYYGRSGLNALGRPVEDETGPCILSIAANTAGRNLQRYHRNLLVSTPPNGKTLEQLLGRTHRDGQEADEVTVEMFLACKEQYYGFQFALKDAQYIQETTGQPQKLINCDLSVMSVDEARALTGALWR